MTLTMVSGQCDIFIMSLRNKPLHCSHGRYAYRLISCLSLRRLKEPNTKTLSRPNTDVPGRLCGNGLKINCRLQLLFEDSCVIKVSAIHAITPIYLRKKPLNCYHGGYTYRLVSWLLRRFSHGQQLGLNDI